MIAWSIAAARESGLFDHVVVSTDDKEIASVAQLLGADVPFLRPAELSNDHIGTSPVVAHAIKWFRLRGLIADPVCCIYATAPFVTAKDLRRGLQVLEQTGSDFAMSVTSYPFPIQRAVRVTAKNRIELLTPEHLETRSQDLEEVFHDAGQFYWGRADAWCSGVSPLGANAAPVLLPRKQVQDIDTLEDWDVAQLMFKSFRS